MRTVTNRFGTFEARPANREDEGICNGCAGHGTVICSVLPECKGIVWVDAKDQANAKGPLMRRVLAALPEGELRNELAAWLEACK